MAIRSFKNVDVQNFYIKGTLPYKMGWTSVASIAKRKLDMLHYAIDLKDLLQPPNNRLEALKGDLKGYHSIRINDQWRVIFRWNDGFHQVDIRDYH